ncbi:MAG: hypothetical protein M3N08_02505 [Pseudomonadota bacterium]|nr:hypothetical protein [Pseudomonadota bacterium]
MTTTAITAPVTTASTAPPAPPVVSPGDPSKPLVQIANNSISPRIVVDPSAGVIIQFLSSTGSVQSQIPSATIVAYLKAGLTSDGLHKVSPQSKA